MKKLIALFLAALMVLTLMTGCSKKEENPGIPAQAFETGSVIYLPLEVELNNGDFVSYGGHQFASKKKLSKMADMVVKENEIALTAATYKNSYGDCVLFTTETPTGCDSWCLYQADPFNTKNQYIFSGLHRTLALEEGDLELLLPLHLISDTYIRDSMGSRLSLGLEYSCGLKEADSTIDSLFQNFYQTSGLYRVTPAQGGFILAPNDPGSKLQLQFSFYEHDESFWFAITDVTVHEPEPVDSISITWTAPPVEEGAEAALPVVATITGSDAMTLSSMLISFDYSGGELELEYPYVLTMDEWHYSIDLLWDDNVWSGRVGSEKGTTALTTKSASIIAAILYNNGLTNASLAESPIPEGIEKRNECMATTGDINVRSEPNTDCKVVTVLAPDTPVSVTGKVDNWYQILFGNELAYMSGDYLKGVN